MAFNSAALQICFIHSTIDTCSCISIYINTCICVTEITEINSNRRYTLLIVINAAILKQSTVFFNKKLNHLSRVTFYGFLMISTSFSAILTFLVGSKSGRKKTRTLTVVYAATGRGPYSSDMRLIFLL